MKKPLLNSFAALLFAGCLISCNGCKENANPSNTPPEANPTDNTTGMGEPETGTSASADAATPTAASTENNSNSVNTSAERKHPKDNKLKGYSAPDGTDAENHDGDMYTRNDTTRMPSGVPIK